MRLDYESGEALSEHLDVYFRSPQGTQSVIDCAQFIIWVAQCQTDIRDVDFRESRAAALRQIDHMLDGREYRAAVEVVDDHGRNYNAVVFGLAGTGIHSGGRPA